MPSSMTGAAEELAAVREKFYDDEIAPALADLASRCNEQGLSFLAVVEWSPGKTGRTRHFAEGFGPTIELADAAVRASNNADMLIGFMVEKAKQTGHSSVYLHMLGVPLVPDAGAHLAAPQEGK